MRVASKLAIATVLGLTTAVSASGQCGFAIRPATDVKWFRAQGWETPGVKDAKVFAPIQRTASSKPQSWDWPDGITAHIALHDPEYSVRFPATLFEQDGQKRRMLARRFRLEELVQWEMDGRVYAYSYSLAPYDVLCTATIDLIDDQGDGKFRWLFPHGHALRVRNPQPPPVPEWLKKPAS